MVPENLEAPSLGLGGCFSEDPLLAFWHGLQGRPSHHRKWNISPLVKKQWMVNLCSGMPLHNINTQRQNQLAFGGSDSSVLRLILPRSVEPGTAGANLFFLMTFDDLIVLSNIFWSCQLICPYFFSCGRNVLSCINITHWQFSRYI